MSDTGPKRSSSTAAELDLTRKKGKKPGRKAAAAQDSVEASLGDYVRVIPANPSGEEDVGPTVQLSGKDKATGLELSADRLSVTGWKGFRSVRATHGFHQGTHYCEVSVQHLGPSGHVRVGWSSKQAEISAPVGYDQHGYGYRDLEGSRVHKALREEYGQPYGEGDVLGLFLHLPEGGRALESRAGGELARFKGALYYVQPEAVQPQPLPGAVVAFTKNGELQGVAYRDVVLEGTYYPTASLFCKPQQKDGATVSFNFGPEFKFQPPAVPGCPAAAPVSDLPAKQQAAEAAEIAAAELAAAGAAAAAAGAAPDGGDGDAGSAPPPAAAGQPGDADAAAAAPAES